MASFTPTEGASLISVPALSFDICQVNGCKSVTFDESTGAYSESNLLGWGTPNPDTDEANSALLYITDPSNNTTLLDLFAPTPNWPTTDEDQLFTIVPTDLNQGNGNFIDGLYKFQYVVYLNDSTEYLTKTVYKYFFCNVECCVDQMFAKITDPSCDCQADAIAAASKAGALLDSLKRAAARGKIATCCALQNVLNKICTNSNCNTCN